MDMKRMMMILLWCLILLAVACGTKKKATERHREKEKVTIDKDVDIDQQIQSRINEIIREMSSGFTAEPMDPDKPSMFGDLVFENVKVTYGSKDRTEERQVDQLQDISVKDKSQEKRKKKESGRKSDVKVTGRAPWLPWLIIPILALAGWWLFKRLPASKLF